MMFSKRYAYTKVKFPCDGCADRSMGCHANCEKYKEARKEADERMRLKAKENVREDEYNNYMAERKVKRNNR